MASSMFFRLVMLLAATFLSPLAAASADGDVRSIPLRTHSLHQPYMDSELQSRWFDFGGDTIVRTDSYIRLVADRPSQAGWVFSRVPLTATSWEVEVEFSITGTGHLYGDGMGIFMTKQRAQEGPVFGFQDQFEGLGVFIDTYKNNRPGTVFPYVMAMQGDGNAHYDVANDGKANELAGCSARGLRNAQFATKIKITYLAEQSLSVSLIHKKDDEWTECFSVPGVKLPQITYLGFTAATGDLSDNFDIVSVETRNLYASGGTAGVGSGSGSGNKAAQQPQQQRQQQQQQLQQQQQQKSGYGKSTAGGSGSSWTWFLLKTVLILLVVAGAYVGFTLYRAQQRDRF